MQTSVRKLPQIQEQWLKNEIFLPAMGSGCRLMPPTKARSSLDHSSENDWGSWQKCFPLRNAGWGGEFGEYFAEFAKNRDTKGVHRHLHDALDFSAWLLSKDLSGEPDWLRKVIDYEQS